MTSETTLPSCYRHPDRETRLSCSNCGRPVCVECVRSAPVGQRCLECAKPSEDQRVMGMDDVRSATTRQAVVTFAILGLTVAIFLLQNGPDSVAGAVHGGLIQINDRVALGQWWRTLTAAFLHGSFFHLGFNMYALYLFGPELERRVGSVPFAGLYFATAVAGGAAFYVAEPYGSAYGASGAVFGLFGAWLAASYRSRHTAAGQASLRQMLMLLGINLAFGFIAERIAWQAHVGGLVAGFVIASAWTLPLMQRRPLARTAAAVAVGLLALLVVL